MMFAAKYRLENFIENHQHTRKHLTTNNELNNKYNEINKNLNRNLRLLNWQRKNHLKERELQETTKFSRKISIQCLQFDNTKANVNLSNKNDISGFQFTLNQLSNFLPSIYKNKGINHGFYNKFFDTTFDNKEKMKKELHKRRKVEKNDKEVSKADEDVRMKFNVKERMSDLDKHVNVFQRLLRGRAYQIMMFVEKIKQEEILKTVLNSEITEHQTSKIDDNEKQNIADDVLDFLTKKCISRCFDTLWKEAIRTDEENKNKILIKQAEKTRIMKEAAESKKRLLEERRTIIQNEMFKQIMKIHQENAELSYEEFIEQAIERSAENESKIFIRTTANTTKPCTNSFYNNNCKEVEADLVLNFIVPEANKAVLRTNMKYNKKKYIKEIRDTVFNINTVTKDQS